MNHLNTKDKVAIITGCNGQVGSYMAEYLLRETDCKVIGTIRRTSKLNIDNLGDVINNERFKLIHLDLADSNSIDSIIKNENPDYFFNFGASAFVPDSWKIPAQTIKVNTISVINILESIRKNKPSCRFYNACSSEIFGDTKEVPQTLNTPPSPRSIYGVSKNAARESVKVYRDSYGLYAVSGILFNHESPRRQEHYVTRKITKGICGILNKIINRESFESLKLGNLDAKRDWSHASDFVDGIWRMVNQDSFKAGFDGKPKDYILSSDETYTIRTLLCITVELFIADKSKFLKDCRFEMRKAPIVNGEKFPTLEKGVLIWGGREYTIVEINEEFYRPAEVNLLLGDSSEIRNDLGWQPKVSFPELVYSMVKGDS